ncbi:PREDICTED: ADP-sugar pyrophosphatase-like isoform X2 [Branchiostoma belcheri]|uniref:ADP-sugar pyrophosphatase n=1 Tax=Branchiostoma belcheri TaxID=7741 RepID=A0A6P4ZBB2_BRABE|nr:PREDICTED: ADP-sugar pyrophosphatase-like isoform X2 [Branchiostoma belcheri]
MMASDGVNGTPGCRFIKEETVYQGEWLSLGVTTYQDPQGQHRTWETVRRTTRCDGYKTDGATVVAVLKRALHYDQLILVQQFRPAINAYTLEFPAGLCDAGESVEDCAIRELREETGYTGQVIQVSPATCMDAGLSNCTTCLVTAQIDGDDIVNIRPKPHPEEGEFLKVLYFPMNELLTRINDFTKKEAVTVDSRVYMYAMALQLSKGKDPVQRSPGRIDKK